MKHAKEFGREIRNHNYEIGPDGIYLPRQGIKIGGVFEHWVERNGEIVQPKQSDHNLMVDEGLNLILDNIYSAGVTSVANWYVGIFKNDATLSADHTSADHSSPLVNEAAPGTDYTQSQRPSYGDNAVTDPGTGRRITNAGGNECTFTIAATSSPNPITIYGAFLTTVATIAANSSGKWSSCSKFSAGRVLNTDDDLVVTYQIDATDV